MEPSRLAPGWLRLQQIKSKGRSLKKKTRCSRFPSLSSLGFTLKRCCAVRRSSLSCCPEPGLFFAVFCPADVLHRVQQSIPNPGRSSALLFCCAATAAEPFSAISSVFSPLAPKITCPFRRTASVHGHFRHMATTDPGVKQSLSRAFVPLSIHVTDSSSAALVFFFLTFLDFLALNFSCL